MRLVWSTTARRELACVVAYIYPHNPAAATRVEACLRTSVEHLQQFPRAGRSSYGSGTREIVITEYPYVIRYRIVADQVQILRIFHTSTQWAPSSQ